MSPMHPPIAEFWRAFVASTVGVDESRFYEAFYFADSEALADSLAELVLSGTKRATASAFHPPPGSPAQGARRSRATSAS